MKEMELTGNINLMTLQSEVPAIVAMLAPGVFQTVADLYRHLQGRGSLTLRDATVTLPLDADRIFMGLNKLVLINSRIYLNGSDVLIVCNEYHNDGSVIESFEPNSVSALSGKDGTSPGADGHDGEDGLNAGKFSVFVTDRINSREHVRLHLPGQKGGQGGNGKIGGKGSKGKNGRNCATGATGCNSGCGNGKIGGNGQKGGDGGNGGNGGDGGFAEFYIHDSAPAPEHFFSFSAEGGSGGYPGAPGSGGEGGDGGDRGKSGCLFCEGRCYAGPQGSPGAPGIGGTVGARGINGWLKRSTFDVQYLKWVLERSLSNTLSNIMPTFEVRTGVADRLS